MHMFILDLTSGFNWLHKCKCKTKRETFKCLNLVRLLIQVWHYVPNMYTDDFPDPALYIHKMLGCGSNFSFMEMEVSDDINFNFRYG